MTLAIIPESLAGTGIVTEEAQDEPHDRRGEAARTPG
jgi:hypothetical protein